MKMKFLAIFLVLLCCLMGAASAAEDISTDAVGDAIDDVVITDEVVDEDLPADDSISVEPADVDSEADQSDVSIETNDEEGNTRASGTATVSTWSNLETYAETPGTDYTITLNDNITIGSTDIIFKNNAVIDGNGKIITGNIGTSRIPFKSNNASLSITFKNIKFQNINCQMLIQLQTNGISKIENCTFVNITTGNDHHSVVYNNLGTMNITNCTFSNCTTGFGVITNYRWGTETATTLNVKDSKFENNYALHEPGAINNCGILTVYNCTFNKNNSTMWAGAIHTHYRANTVIEKSIFKENYAKENGGALFTYSILEIYDSIFEDNICNGSTGGGAIGSYNYISTYDIWIENCTFKNNKNTNESSHGGAITALNGGYLNVYDSIFINNSADVGQAICAYNQHIENGTHDKPYLAVENCNFTNHTGSNDTVYVSGYVNAFNNNHFVNSTQTPISGSGNTYNNIINPTRSNSKVLLGISDNSLLTDTSPHDTIYVNVSSSNDGTRGGKNKVTGDSWAQAYGLSTGFYWAFQHINPNGTIIMANGEYIFDTTVEDVKDSLAPHFCTIIGYEDNVKFVFPEGYDLDFVTAYDVNDGTGGTISTLKTTITHENIIFDCDVKVGGRNFKFVNCTFNKGLNLSHTYTSDDVFEMTFENCTFANPKSDIAIADKVTASFDDDCTFPVTAVDSVVDINSTEKGVVVVTLTDNSSSPIANAPFKYTVNGGEEQTATTGDDGKYSITGLTGEVTIAVTYDGNESYNPVNGTQTFNFTDEPAPSNDTNGSNSTPVTPTKTVTKLTATKVTATYNVAKKLVITLKDANGKALANKKVTVKVGSITKTLKTNSKGQVSLNVATLVPKTYTATVKFAGDSSYKASTVKPKVVVNKAKVKLAAKAKTFKLKAKVKKYTTTLKDNKGKVMKSTKLTLKIGKKTYTAKTNKKGVATFKVKLTKKGKNTATVKFAGNKYFKALSKKVKITVK